MHIEDDGKREDIEKGGTQQNEAARQGCWDIHKFRDPGNYLLHTTYPVLTATQVNYSTLREVTREETALIRYLVISQEDLCTLFSVALSANQTPSPVHIISSCTASLGGNITYESGDWECPSADP